MKLNKVESKINELTIKHAKEIEQINSKINAAQTTVDNTADAIREAQEAGDSKAYAKAANENRTAEDMLKMHETQLAKVNAAQVITAQEYTELKAEIFEGMAEIEQNAITKLAEVMETMQSLYDDVIAGVLTANNLLHQVQRKLYKQPLNISRLENGRQVTVRTMEDHYKHPAIYETLKRVLPYIKKICAGQKDKESN